MYSKICNKHLVLLILLVWHIMWLFKRWIISLPLSSKNSANTIIAKYLDACANKLVPIKQTKWTNQKTSIVVLLLMYCPKIMFFMLLVSIYNRYLPFLEVSKANFTSHEINLKQLDFIPLLFLSSSKLSFNISEKELA